MKTHTNIMGTTHLLGLRLYEKRSKKKFACSMSYILIVCSLH